MVCDHAIDARINAWKNYNSNKTSEKWQQFLNIRKQTSKIIWRKKRNYDKRQTDEIEQDFKKNNTRNFYKTFKEQLTGYQPPNLCFKKPDGSLETNTKKNCKILADYFNTLLNCEGLRNDIHFKTSTPNPDSEPPTIKEILEIIKALKQ